jgi:serine protease Do
VRDDPTLAKKAEQFVKLRLTFLRGVDIGLFDFDFDQTWMAFFLDANGRVYSRYGSRSAASSESHNSVQGLADTLERVLALHKQRREQHGPPAPMPEPKRPTDLPGLNALGFGGSCVRCHMVHEGLFEQKRRDGKLEPGDLWLYPVPETIGLTLDPKLGTVVRDVLPDSAAAKADLHAGDEVRAANGTAILTIADLQHVLNGLPAKARLTLDLTRGARQLQVVLDLDNDWKRWDVSWRRSVRNMSRRQSAFVRALALVAPGDRKKLGIPEKAIGFRLNALGGEAQNAGLQKDDIVIAFDGKREVIYQNAQLYMYLEHKKGDTMKVTVLRAGKEETVDLLVP